MKRFRTLIALLLLGLLCLALPACRKKVVLPETVVSVLKIKINPEINIFLNASGEVVSILPANADGQQVLDTVDGDWGTGKLADVVRKIVDTSIAEGFLKEGGDVTLQFFSDTEELSAVQQTVDAALEQARQEAAVAFTVTDPAVAPIRKYQGDAPDFNRWDGYAVWDTETRDENGILTSADGTLNDGDQVVKVSLRYDADRSETTITMLRPDGTKEITVYSANGQMNSFTHISPSGAEEVTEYFPDGSIHIYSYFLEGIGHRDENWPNGQLKLRDSRPAENERHLTYCREDGTSEKESGFYPDGTYWIYTYYEDGKTVARREALDAEGRLTVDVVRRNGCPETKDVTGPGSYTCHEDYNEEGRLIKSLTTDPDTGLYVMEENYPSGGRKYYERRDAGSYTLEEYLENGTIWHVVIEEPDGYKYTRVEDEEGNVIKEEGLEANGIHWINELTEDGRRHEYQDDPTTDSVVENYGILNEDGTVTYTYSYHKQGDDYLQIMETLPDGGTRTEITNQGMYQLDVTYSDGSLRHQEIRQPHGLSLIYDYRPDGSASRLEEIYLLEEGSMQFVIEYDEAGGFHETHTDNSGVQRFVLDVQPDGSWKSVEHFISGGDNSIGLNPQNYTETREYMPGQYYQEYKVYNLTSEHYSMRIDASGHLHVEHSAPELADDPTFNYDGPASCWSSSGMTLETYKDKHESHFPREAQHRPE